MECEQISMTKVIISFKDHGRFLNKFSTSIIQERLKNTIFAELYNNI